MCELTCFGPSVTTLPCCWRGWLGGTKASHLHTTPQKHSSDENETAKPSEALPHPSHTVAGVDTQAVANGVGSALRNGRHLHQARAVPSTRHKKASEDAFLRMRRQPRRIVSTLGPLQLGSRLLRAAGGKIGGACGRGGTEDIPTLHGGHNRALRFQTPDSEIPMRSCTGHREGKWGEEGARASCSRRIRPRTSRRGTPQVSRSPLPAAPEP